jgi:hypothetical protein
MIHDGLAVAGHLGLHGALSALQLPQHVERWPLLRVLLALNQADAQHVKQRVVRMRSPT